jgi:hypothetical protein
MAHNHTFACPVFALQNQLAAGNSIPKWSPRARLGLNLGQSPMHTRNVYLVLNLSTGLVSPQYHCRFDGSLRPQSMVQMMWWCHPHGNNWQVLIAQQMLVHELKLQPCTAVHNARHHLMSMFRRRNSTIPRNTSNSRTNSTMTSPAKLPESQLHKMSRPGVRVLREVRELCTKIP